MSAAGSPSLAVVVREWGRIGCIGFGGPPAHIALLRGLCVERREWMTAEEFEDAIAATNLLPGPASTQVAIYCAWRLRGVSGALAGGLGFILPGLVLIVALAALFLGSPPDWVLGAGAGAGAAVAAVAVRTGVDLAGPSLARASGTRVAWSLYALAGAAGAIFAGAWLVTILVGCGIAGLLIARSGDRSELLSVGPLATLFGSGTAASLAWTALKVGAFSYGGGFVIIPLMQADAVDVHHWMSHADFLNAVALGQITPGPVVHTVAVVGYAASGVGGALLAALVAFGPSFVFVIAGAARFDRLRGNSGVRAFLDGAGPAAVGAIIGIAIPLALALDQTWQAFVLAGAAALIFVGRRSVVLALLASGAAGTVLALAGAPLPG